MDHNNAINPTTLFAGGSIIAAAGLLWGHVKQIYTQISSVVIQRALLDKIMYVKLMIYLRANHYRLPTGYLAYLGIYMQIRGKSEYSVVPFHSNPSSAYFLVGKTIVHLDQNNIVAIRGSINLDKLVVAALEYNEGEYLLLDQLQSDDDIHKMYGNHFEVRRIYGIDKNSYDTGDVKQDQPQIKPKRRSSSSTSRDDPDDGTLDIDNRCIGINHALDESFRFKKEDYLFVKNHDPFHGLYYSENVLKYIEKAKQWRMSGLWYEARSLPWRMGWLLYGIGGTGKSSMAKALAQLLGIPVYQFYMSTLSNNEFIRAWNDLATPCIVALEDFDNTFNKRELVDKKQELSFDTVLNTLSGIDSKQGIFLIITTNRLESIDPAIGLPVDGGSMSTRPGRIDTLIELGNLDRTGRYKMAQRIMCDWPDCIEDLVNRYGDVTPAQFQEACVQEALSRLANNNFTPILDSQLQIAAE